MKTLYTYYKYKKFERLSDEELFNFIADRNSRSELAFTVIYDRYSQKVWQYCFRMLGDSDLAKDILQETFLNFYNKIKKSLYVPDISVLLLAEARRLCIGFLKHEVKTIPYTDEEELPIESRKDNSELMTLIKKSIEKLPPKYKEALVLREIQQLTYLEIEALTGETMANVKVRIHRARTRVRKMLQQHIEDLERQNAL